MSAALLDSFDLLADRLGGVAKLRELILSLAVRGRLVPQDPNDEPASELLKRIRAEKDRLIKEGKIKQDKQLPEIREDEPRHEWPEGWACVRFGDYCHEVCTGPFGSIIHKEDYVSGGVPLINPSHMVGGLICPDPDVSLPHEKAKEFAAYALSAGDIVLARRGEVGRYAVVTAEECGWLCGTGSFFVKFAREPNRAFLGLLFSSSDLRAHLQGKSVGTTMVNLNQKILLEMPLGIPPLAEQSRIVAKVEELMALCDRLEAEQGHAARVQGHWVEAALDQLAESADADEFRRHWQHLAAHFDTLFTTPESIDRLDATLLQLAVRGKLVPQDPTDEPASELLKQIRGERERLIKEGKIKRDKPLPPVSEDEQVYMLPMGWEWTRLQDLALAGPTNGFSPRPSPEETDFRCLTLSATTKGHLRPECFKFVEVDERTAQQFYLKQGDLLIQRGNSIDYVGISAIYDLPSDRFIYPDLMMRIQLTPSVDSRFVHRWLNCTFGRTYFMKNATGTQGTMPKVNQTTVARTPVPLPPLAEQSRIVAQVEKLLSLTASLKARLTAAQTKQAHLAEALVAELTTATPTAPNAEERFAKRA